MIENKIGLDNNLRFDYEFRFRPEGGFNNQYNCQDREAFEE